MAYINLEELEKILPGILNQWIDEEDESWEWIFNEIEQKCRIGKRLKGKKWKKKLVSMVDTHSTVLVAHRNDINELNKKIDELNEEAKRVHKDLSNIKQITLKDLSDRIEQVRSMAQTAKQRTEIDYSKYSGKSDGLSKEFEKFKKEQEDKHKAQGNLFDMIIMRIKEIEGVLNGEEAKKHTQEIIEALKVNPKDKIRKDKRL